MKKLDNALKNKNALLLLVRHYENDSNLIRVFCYWQNEYVIWCYNIDNNSFNFGKYYNDNQYEQALEKWYQLEKEE